MEKEYIKASEYAKKMSLHIRTVYRYYHNGKIKGYQDKETGTIFILNPFKNKNNKDNLDFFFLFFKSSLSLCLDIIYLISYDLFFILY